MVKSNTVIYTKYVVGYSWNLKTVSSDWSYVKESRSTLKLFGLVLFDRTYPAHLVSKTGINSLSLEDARSTHFVEDDVVYYRPFLEIYMKDGTMYNLYFDTDQHLMLAVKNITVNAEIQLGLLLGVVYYEHITKNHY